MMKKIALIYMGGTFGCIGEPLQPMPEQDFLPFLLKVMPTHLQVECFATPQIKDSSACTAVDWLKLIQKIQNLQLNGFEHFIIIHGTDTLAYAAATLAHILGHCCHVIFTGSQYPLLNVEGSNNREFSDALDNLFLALEQVLVLPKGVYLAFHHQVFHAQTALKIHTIELAAFTGLAASSPFESNTQHLSIENSHLERASKFNLLNIFIQPIAQEYLAIQLKNILINPPDFLILQGFGSGNIAINDDLLQLFEALYQKDCLVIISSQVPFGALNQHYAVSSWINSAKVLISDCYSPADLYAKTLQMYLKYPTHAQRFEHWSLDQSR